MISSVFWALYIIFQTMLFYYETGNAKMTAAIQQVSKLFMVLGSGATTSTNVYNMQRVVLHEKNYLEQNPYWSFMVLLAGSVCWTRWAVFLHLYFHKRRSLDTCSTRPLQQVAYQSVWKLDDSQSCY